MLALFAIVISQAASSATESLNIPKLPTEMRILTQEELRARVVGKRLTDIYDHPPGLDYDTDELFFEDGRYARWFHGNESGETYRFIGNRLCIRSKPDRERCRTGFVDTNGDLWLLSADEGREGLKRMTIRQINK